MSLAIFSLLRSLVSHSLVPSFVLKLAGPPRVHASYAHVSRGRGSSAPCLGWLIDRFGPQWVIPTRRRRYLRCGLYAPQLRRFAARLLWRIHRHRARQPACGGFFPLGVTLIHWFERHRARALSTVEIGFALGGLVLPLVAWALALGVGVPQPRLRHPSSSRFAYRFPWSSGAGPRTSEK